MYYSHVSIRWGRRVALLMLACIACLCPLVARAAITKTYSDGTVTFVSAEMAEKYGDHATARASMDAYAKASTGGTARTTVDATGHRVDVSYNELNMIIGIACNNGLGATATYNIPEIFRGSIKPPEPPIEVSLRAHRGNTRRSAGYSPSYQTIETNATHYETQVVDYSVYAQPYYAGGSGSQQPPAAQLAMDANIEAFPLLVRVGETTTLTWSAVNAATCTVSGTNGDEWSGTSSPEEGQESSPLEGETAFTLECTALPNAIPTSLSKSVTVDLIPIFQEL